MIALDQIRQMLEADAEWSSEGSAHWLDATSFTVRQLATVMRQCSARFVTITAYELPKDAGLRMEYHWDLNGTLLGFRFALEGKTIDSICDLCEAADWIEREVHEEYAIEFLGRTCDPLLLRTGDPLGVNLREVRA